MQEIKSIIQKNTIKFLLKCTNFNETLKIYFGVTPSEPFKRPEPFKRLAFGRSMGPRKGIIIHSTST